MSDDKGILWERMAEIAKSVPTPIQHWLSSRLAEIKPYLETKDPATFTREDHYLTAKYSVMRYLPEDDQRTNAEWQEQRAALHRKIDINIDHPDKPKEPIKDSPDFAEWLKQHMACCNRNCSQ